ncbi:uncharacterized protein LOC105703942 isoform X2 [Orussus abietinus]|nr:uncharacterized protein LOC105703942 isoform X2 [Orussus abietinus]
MLKSEEQYSVKILSIERGYNKEFLAYNIFIVNVPLDRIYEILENQHDCLIDLNCNITSYKDALTFLIETLRQDKSFFEECKSDLQYLDIDHTMTAKDMSKMFQELACHYWANIMHKQSLDLQRDARYQKLLSTSLEIFIMHHLHDRVYPILSEALDQDDLYMKKKIDQLMDLRITPDQLGVQESFAICLPAAIVELATLDAREEPLQKLLCLRNTLDLIVAEVKGALADVKTKTDDNCENICSNYQPSSSKSLSSDDLIPLLAYVIVKARPTRLMTDLHYVKNLLWSVSPHDGQSYSLVMFKAAISLLQDVNIHALPERSSKVKLELPIGELLEVVNRPETSLTPLDTQIHQLATMLEKCTHDEEPFPENSNK